MSCSAHVGLLKPWQMATSLGFKFRFIFKKSKSIAFEIIALGFEWSSGIPLRSKSS